MCLSFAELRSIHLRRVVGIGLSSHIMFLLLLDGQRFDTLWLVVEVVFLELQSAHVRVALRDVSNPAVGRVAGHVFSNSQVSNIEVGDIVHGDFEIHIDGTNLSPYLCGAGSVQSDLGLHGLFRSTW